MSGEIVSCVYCILKQFAVFNPSFDFVISRLARHVPIIRCIFVHIVYNEVSNRKNGKNKTLKRTTKKIKNKFETSGCDVSVRTLRTIDHDYNVAKVLNLK